MNSPIIARAAKAGAEPPSIKENPQTPTVIIAQPIKVAVIIYLLGL
jgi:hypothetical protein